jgi:hypothetical protein
MSMSVERRRRTTFDAPTVSDPRRAHLQELCRTVTAYPRFAAGLVEQYGVAVVNVTYLSAAGGPVLAQDIGCDRFGETWWFVWANDGTRIAPASELNAAVQEIASEMGADS